ncbi:hypothetical protein AB4097_21160 [Microvirga sp. 2MCAF35]|uniref:competence protein CoiA family protein n=1 Tax=Microvirga sp. 2MCAF35 TaxID=3232987 RepID=UPI003F954A49
MAHVSEVASGLECGCICPGCGSRLVARKGPKNDHHFGHDGSADGRPCKTGPETALHKFAKEVLAKRLRLFLPALEMSDGDDRWVGFQGGSFGFHEAVLEHRLEEIVPDVIVRRGERDLLVEFAVTHVCGPEKIDRIALMDIGAIEIDLSGLARDVSRDGLEEAILDTAPRKWLHNPRFREGWIELEARRRKRTEALARRTDALRDAYLSSCAKLQTNGTPCLAVGRIREDGLDRAISLEVGGMGCFTVPPRDWQATVLADVVDVAVAGSIPFVSVNGALRKLRDRRWIQDRFSRVTDAEAAMIREDGTTFELPENAVMEWIVVLSRKGILMPASGGGRWFLHRMIVDEVSQRRHRRALPGLRQAELRKAVGDILKDLPEDEVAGFSFESWFGALLPGREHSPVQAIHFEDREYARLMTDLTTIGGRIRFNSKGDVDLMGLPLSGTLARRREELRREEETREAERQERTRREAQARADRLLGVARRELGLEGDAWAAAANDALGGKSPMQVASAGETGMTSALEALDTLMRLREGEARKAEAAEKARWNLRREAAKVHHGQHLEIYLKAGHPALGGRSPSAFCLDEATLRRCVELTLDGGKRRR